MYCPGSAPEQSSDPRCQIVVAYQATAGAWETALGSVVDARAHSIARRVVEAS